MQQQLAGGFGDWSLVTQDVMAITGRYGGPGILISVLCFAGVCDAARTIDGTCTQLWKN
jgi:hypothetical protein